MARRKDAAQRAEQQAPEKQEQPAAASTPQAGRTLRQRRRQQQPESAAAAAAVPEGKAALVDPVETMPWYKYYPWQYGGVALGTLACVNTMVFYDQRDEHMVFKLMAWMFLALLSLAIHETRPYKRMDYGDKAREQGVTIKSAFGL